jgi:hypothetical protein
MARPSFVPGDGETEMACLGGKLAETLPYADRTAIGARRSGFSAPVKLVADQPRRFS